MQAFKTLKVVSLHTGHIGLDERQAKARQSCLKPLGDGVFEIVRPVQFKAGEMIRLAPTEKAVLQSLECLEGKEAEETDKATARGRSGK